MSGPKVLDLDQLEVGTEKTIILKGKRYTMRPFSVKDFIEQMKSVSNAENQSVEDAFEVVVDSIVKAFPGIPRDDVMEMEMPKLNRLHEFIRATNEEEVAEGKE